METVTLASWIKSQVQLASPVVQVVDRNSVMTTTLIQLGPIAPMLILTSAIDLETP